MRGHTVPVFLWVYCCFIYWKSLHGVMSTDLTVVFKTALNNILKPILSTLAWLLKRIFFSTKSCFPFSFCLLLRVLSAISAPHVLCWDPVPGEDLERNDGSSSRPYYMSTSLHKILRKGEEGAKSCTTSWNVLSGHFNELLTHSRLHICCKCGGGSLDIWERLL